MIPKDCKRLAEVDFPMPRSARKRHGRSAVEVLGRGTNRVIEMCGKHGAPPPVFEEKQRLLVVTFKAPLVAGGAAGTSRSESGDQVGTKSGSSRDQVEILRLCREERSLIQLMSAIGRQNRTKFRDGLIRPLLEGGLLAHTIPGKPRSRVQRYRTTEAGLAVATAHASGRPPVSPVKPPDSGPGAPRSGSRKKTSKGRKGR